MSEKREQLLNTALALFYRHGVHSIGINEVIKASGIAKRTLYSHFKSKDELILAALQLRHQAFRRWLKQELEPAQSNEQLIELLLEALNRWFNNQAPQLGDFRGCFFINTAAEFSDPNSEIARYCDYHKQEIKALIASKLITPKAGLVEAIYLVKEGAITCAYVSGNADSVIATGKQLLQRF